MSEPVSAGSLQRVDVFIAAGRPPGSGTFSYYEYEGGQHDVTTLSGYFTRVADELTRVLNP